MDSCRARFQIWNRNSGSPLNVAPAAGMVHGYPMVDFLWTGPGPMDACDRRVRAFLRRPLM